MSRKRLVVLGAILVLVALPLLANILTSASATADCSGYTLTVSATDLVRENAPYTVNYSFNLTCQSSPVNGSITINFSDIDDNGNATVQATGSWPGAPLTTNCNVNGSATLTSSGSTQPIIINGSLSPTLSCGSTKPPPCTTVSNPSGFNGTPVASGDSIWFNSNVSVSGIPSTGATIFFTNSTIDLGGTTLPVPDGQIVFSPTATCASTVFDTGSNSWITTVPISGSDEIFLSGLSYPLTAPLAGGTKVTWDGSFTSTTPGITVNWKWGAAVYKTFSTDLNQLNVKPTHANACSINNSDHAGTPEAFKQFVTGGARGGGGSNFTGSWSGTVKVVPCS